MIFAKIVARFTAYLEIALAVAFYLGRGRFDSNSCGWGFWLLILLPLLAFIGKRLLLWLKR